MKGYTQMEIDEINKSIYDVGKIWFKPNQNWTSSLWENLKRQGYTCELIKTSFVKIFDQNKNVVVDVNNGWINALIELSKVMR